MVQEGWCYLRMTQITWRDVAFSTKTTAAGARRLCGQAATSVCLMSAMHLIYQFAEIQVCCKTEAWILKANMSTYICFQNVCFCFRVLKETLIGLMKCFVRFLCLIHQFLATKPSKNGFSQAINYKEYLQCLYLPNQIIFCVDYKVDSRTGQCYKFHSQAEPWNTAHRQVKNGSLQSLAHGFPTSVARPTRVAYKDPRGGAESL